MPKPFVFTLMPFHSSFDDIYKLGIKTAVEEAGGYCERVDEQVYDERMLDRIYNQINKADFIIADVTGKNPNVFYEIGYAHALNKKVILLASSSDDIPFDLKHHYHVVHNNKISHLKEQLISRLSWYFSNPSSKVSTVNQLNFYIEKQKIEQNSIIEIRSILRSSNKEFSEVKLGVGVENFTDIVHNEKLLIAVLIPADCRIICDDRHFKSRVMPDGKTIITTKYYVEEILPSDYTILPDFVIVAKTELFNNGLPFEIRLLKEASVNKIEFVLAKYNTLSRLIS